MRCDVNVYNEACSFGILSEAGVARIMGQDEPDVRSLHDGHIGLAMELAQDDGFVARLIVDEKLTPEEDAQWVGHTTARLEIPNGRLILCAGLDPDVLDEWKEMEEEGEDSEEEDEGMVHAIEVPPGSYRVDVYSYLNTVNGDFIRREAFPEPPLGHWFREDHPGKPYPAWLVMWLGEDPDELDPGNESFWDDYFEGVQSNRIPLDQNQSAVVDFVIHLSPWAENVTVSTPSEEGFYGAGTGGRKPEKFPLGIRSTTIRDENHLPMLLDDEDF